MIAQSDMMPMLLITGLCIAISLFDTYRGKHGV
jgi:fructose-specific phosphotransferase system IIC component